MLSRFTIYGERCSGTTYLENIITMNFDAEVTWKYGWKHFFGFQDKLLENSNDTLFICIVRDPCKWINSLFREMHHLPLKYKTNMSQEEKIDEFLNKEFWSFNDTNGNRDTTKEMKQDRNIYTGERYKNIFELRHTKIKWMLEELPNKVNNYIFIRYEDLKTDFENTMDKLKNAGLKVRDNIKYPLNSSKFKFSNKPFVEKKDKISKDGILNNPNLIKQYEEILGYI